MKGAGLNVEKLTAYLHEKDLNTSKLAEKIGVSPSCMSRVLNQKREPSGLVWSGLIGYFGKKVFDYVIFFDINVSNDTMDKNRGGSH
ncbi:hypothetical protein J23TS9_06350 [Paenibacillus sp. J23TS9]|uniref:helix-turn-helix domain-containing protein n=1 Tax=Paenibacillus sp. J23TS9 TaxID=2807193 RepID=UPI001B2C1E30|nr:helix-turn-helix transcriptional regulator [Paenibacillus sp. J23TS9]GIP25505.1 hypothetical protein J23TS9_06350 [Paenibacillus sp. J23TS9]